MDGFDDNSPSSQHFITDYGMHHLFTQLYYAHRYKTDSPTQTLLLGDTAR